MILLLPAAFRMPDWWDANIDITLIGSATLVGLVFALLLTRILWYPLRHWRQATMNWSWLELARFIYLILALVLVWYAVVMGLIQLFMLL